MIDWKRIKLLIIDMDNTLADTFHTLSKPQWEHVERAMRERGMDAYADTLTENFGKKGFKATLESTDMTREQIEFAIAVYDDVDVSPLALFPDARAILNTPLPKVLLSRGEPELQWKKIRHLRIEKDFDEIIVIDTFETKRDALSSILDRHKLRPEEALIIGDRTEEEIEDGNRLGIPTVLVKRPGRPVHECDCTPDMVVTDLHEVARHF